MTATEPAKATTKHRRNKPVHYGRHHNVRLGDDEEFAVEYMRKALAKQRGVDLEKVKFSEALRLLVTENAKAALAYAMNPDAVPPPKTEMIDLPIEFWDGLTECRNRLSHSQGSLYTVMRKLNFAETVSKDEVREAFEAVQESKAAVARLEALGVTQVTTKAGADAEADTEAA